MTLTTHLGPTDVMVNKQITNEGLREISLFAGAGGGILGGQLLGWETVCAVEIEKYPASVLCQRQNDGLLPPFPIWDDICTFDGKPWRGIVDVVSGGFPCQDISVAGKGAGLDGERSGLWSEMARIIGEVRPRYAFIENSPMLVTRGLERVLCDLAEMGFDARWGVISAADVGAPHKRERIWIVGKLGDTDHYGSLATKKPRSTEQGSDHCATWQAKASKLARSSQQLTELADPTSKRQQGQGQPWQWGDKAQDCEGQAGHAVSMCELSFWTVEPNLGRVANGVAARMDRLKAIGNGQVPQCAAEAFRILSGEI